VSGPGYPVRVSPGADLAVIGSRVWVGDGTTSDAIAVRGGRVVALGEDVTEWIGPRTHVLDRVGALVVPGFQDAHVHVPQAGRNLNHVDLRELASRAAYLAKIARYVADHPDASWVVGGGWSMEHFPGGTPHRDDLDMVTAGKPAFLFNRDVHGAWVNSAALDRAGIDAGTPDPSDGRYERDADGTPVGMLHEGAAYSFEADWVPAPSRPEWERAILTSQRHLHSLGITSWQDAWVTAATLEAYRSLAGDGRLTAQVVGALWWDRHGDLDQIAGFRGQREQGLGNFSPTTVKIMVDGIIENQTAGMIEPFCDGCGGHTGNSGLMYVDRDMLLPAVTELDRLGFQVHMHAIGDRAIRTALDAVAAARAANGPSDNRHHIAHVQVVQPEDILRFADLGVGANCQTYWAQREPQMEEHTIPWIGRERADMQYPFGSLRRAGTRLAMGSDWPVTTADPLRQMEVAVRRIDPDMRAGAPFLPEERLNLDAVLAGFTSGTAYLNHDHDGGRLTVGSRADFAVLDRDLFELNGMIADASVQCTVASGNVVFGDH
jgi:predicted amidohydrolase YtcJ